MKKNIIASFLTVTLIISNSVSFSANDLSLEENQAISAYSLQNNNDSEQEEKALFEELNADDYEVLELDAGIDPFFDFDEEKVLDDATESVPDNETLFVSEDVLIEDDEIDESASFYVSEENSSLEEKNSEEELVEEEATEEGIIEDTMELSSDVSENTVYSGVDGNISWSVENGVLTLSGDGAMNDYASGEDTPWYETCVRDYVDATEGMITQVVIESGITTIGNYAFYNCRHVENITVPTSVKQVGDYAFAYCSKLGSISIPNGSSDNKIFGSYVFFNCTSLTTITIGNNYIAGLDYTSFLGCPLLSEINFTKKYSTTFADYNSYYGQLVQIIDRVGFTYSSLTGSYEITKMVKCPPQMKRIGSPSKPNLVLADYEISPFAYCNCDNATILTMNDTVRRIGNNAFQNCSNLQSVELAKCLEEIDELAFSECRNLESISIPGCVRYIGRNAFNGCTGLRSIYFRGNAPTIDGSIFSSDVIAIAYYPEENDTWNQEVMSQFGVNISWQSYSSELTVLSDEEYAVLIQGSGIMYDGKNYIPVFEYDGNEYYVPVAGIRKRQESVDHYDSCPLTEGVNYTIRYIDNNVNSGTGIIEFTGIGEFTGSLTQSFAIKPIVHEDTIAKVYDGTEKKLQFTVDGDATLYYSTLASLTFENYAEEGTTEVPSRITAGTTPVYYIAVPNHNPSKESCVTGETELTVEKGNQELSVDVTSSSIEVGESIQIIASCKAGSISYVSDNESIAAVDDDGIITGISEGATRIRLTASETANYQKDEVYVEVIVTPYQEISISDCFIDIETGLTYSGSPVEPKITVKYNGKILVQDKDYSLRYRNNTQVGTGTVIITGLGKCVGSVTKNFEIKEPSGKPINECEITLSEEQLIYNGKVQTPGVTIKDGDSLLQEGKDFEVSYEEAIDAGEYSLTVSGLEEYSGTKELAFEIVPANPSLKFEFSELDKRVGDEPFINVLEIVTDGALSYSSEDESIAVVDEKSGEVTILTSGTVIIKVIASAGKNYLSGEDGYILKVTDKEKGLSIENLSFSFPNKRTSFGYSKDYCIPLSSFQIIFGKTTKANFYYGKSCKMGWRGSCVGLSSASSLLIDQASGVAVNDFDIGANTIQGLKADSYSAGLNIDITTFIEALQTAQSTQLFNSTMCRNRITTEDSLQTKTGTLNGLYYAIKEEIEAGRPVVLILQQEGLGHAVLAYGINDVSEEEHQILLYDNNYPLQERTLTMKKDATGNYMDWSYEIGEGYGVWSTKRSSSAISYVPYDVIKEIWSTRGHLKENENIVSMNSHSVAIYDSENNIVATVTQGDLTTKSGDIRLIEDLSLEKEDGEQVLLSLPVDVYTFDNLDKSVSEFEVAMANTNLGATVATSAGSVTMAVDDSCNMNAVFISAEENDTYSITLNSSFSYDEDNVVVTGKGSGEKLEVSQMRGNINISNCQITSLSIDGKEIERYMVKASAGSGGEITPTGDSVVTKGETLSYVIEPSAGYQVSDVLVDGKSVGAVSAYTFENIDREHEIQALFKKVNADIGEVSGNTEKAADSNPSKETSSPLKTQDSGENKSTEPDKDKTEKPANKETDTKKPNQITAENITKITSKKAQSFSLKVSVLGNAKLRYSSNNKSVKVGSKGKLTIAKNFVGSATITIKAEATKDYLEAQKNITITVNPAAMKLGSIKKSGAGKVTVTWKRNSKVTGYQIQYSTSSSFKNGKIKTIGKNKTVKLVLKNLKKSKKYYVRMRVFKKVGGRKYYSRWSKWKLIKVR